MKKRDSMGNGKIERPHLCSDCNSREQSIFCDLGLEELSSLSEHRVVNLYKKGQTLFIQGNPPYGCYCVSSGKIKISMVGADGKESIVRLAVAGDVVGHRSLFSEQYYSATATAIEDSVVCFYDKKFMLKLIKQKPEVAYRLITKMGRDLGRAEKKVSSLYQKNVQERLAELLLNLKQTYGVQNNGKWMLDIKLTREEMASMIGTASETLIRFISDFKDNNLIEQRGKTLYLLDLEGLKQFANISEEKYL